MTTSPSRSVIVTGAGSGIGKATAARFVAAGDRVVVSDIDGAAAETVAASLGPDAIAVAADVADEEAVAGLVASAVEAFGGVDVLVSNAGIGGGLHPLVDTPLEEFDRVVAVHLRGVFLGLKHGARRMAEQGRGGAIVNMASIAALSAGCGGHAYSACKAGILSLTRTAALELAEHRIRVNAICPGGIVTPMLVGLPPGTPIPDEVLAGFDIGQPWPEHGRPEDIAEGALWLASPAARFMTGQALTIDGGIHAAGPLASIRAFGAALEAARAEPVPA